MGLMALTKRTLFGSCTVLPDGQLQVKMNVVIEEDGKELSRTPHRYVLAPGVGVDKEPEEVKRIAKSMWTKPVVDTFKKAH